MQHKNNATKAWNGTKRCKCREIVVAFFFWCVSQMEATNGCQNSWRKTEFQCTVNYGTFVKVTSHYFSDDSSDQGTFKKAKWQLGSKCPSDNSTLKTSIASPILTPIGDGVCDISVIVPWPLEHSHWDKEISSSVTFSGNLHFIPPRLIFLAFSSN